MPTLIITGGTVDVPFFKEYLKGKNFQHIIAVDGGLVSAQALGFVPDYIVGDFDTLPYKELAVYEQRRGIHIRRYQPEKDDTDTQIAAELAMQLEKEEVIFLGATGTRIDHMLANIFLLEKFADSNIYACCLDSHNKARILNHGITIQKSEQYGAFISFLALTEQVEGITLKGFKYPLVSRTLWQADSLCISNEIIEETAEISFTKGRLLMVEARD